MAVITDHMKDEQAEFHDAYILHHSDENRSKKRRCAFIARLPVKKILSLLILKAPKKVRTFSCHVCVFVRACMFVCMCVCFKNEACMF